MSKKKLFKQIIDIPLLGTGVLVIIGSNEDIKRDAKRRLNYEVDATETKGFCWCKDGSHPIIYVYDSSHVDTLVHEIIHASWQIMKHAGIEVTYDNNEFQAHLVGYILKEIKK